MTLQDAPALDADTDLFAEHDATGQRSAMTRRDIRLHLAIANWLYATRAERPGCEIPGLYGEAAWDILISLYIREGAAERTDVSSACLSARVPPTTALRHIKTLCDHGWLIRAPDQHDRRRFWLHLSPWACKRLDDYLARAAQGLTALLPLLNSQALVMQPRHADACLNGLRTLAAHVDGLIEAIEGARGGTTAP